ncbi:MAG: helix-turn-helix transcriptional regulator [Gemmatimonadetes bacterium]|nr:helix-turn-helix transcriptional regulator [Gemmatimonadota bacterium]
MPRPALSHRAVAAAVAGVRRACYAGHDSLSLRRAVGARLSTALQPTAWSLAATDPATGLIVHRATDGVPSTLSRDYLVTVYPGEEAMRLIDMARTRTPALVSRTPAVGELLAGAGFGHRLLAAFSVGDTLFGAGWLMRERGAPPFDDADTRLIDRVAPHVGRALRHAALVEAALAAPASGAALSDAPGVLTFDARGTALVRTAAAEAILDDLADDERNRSDVPGALGGVLAQLRWRQSRAALDTESSLDGALRVRGRSGRWYTLHASLTEPGPTADATTVVVLAPAPRAPTATGLTSRYGLSARESDVLLRVARGESTKELVAALGISAYTVQDYVSRASEKLGVRGRRELVARLFRDAFGDGSR